MRTQIHSTRVTATSSKETRYLMTTPRAVEVGTPWVTSPRSQSFPGKHSSHRPPTNSSSAITSPRPIPRPANPKPISYILYPRVNRNLESVIQIVMNGFSLSPYHFKPRLQLWRLLRWTIIRITRSLLHRVFRTMVSSTSSHLRLPSSLLRHTRSGSHSPNTTDHFWVDTQATLSAKSSFTTTKTLRVETQSKRPVSPITHLSSRFRGLLLLMPMLLLASLSSSRASLPQALRDTRKPRRSMLKFLTRETLQLLSTCNTSKTSTGRLSSTAWTN